MLLDNVEKTWRCELRSKSDSGPCGAVFATKGQLVLHQIHYHEVHHPVASCVIGNCCPACYSTSASTSAAREHLKDAYASGHCRVDMARHLWPAEVPHYGLYCHLCSISDEAEFPSMRDLLAHVRGAHLPAPIPTVLPSNSLLKDATKPSRRRGRQQQRWPRKQHRRTTRRSPRRSCTGREGQEEAQARSGEERQEGQEAVEEGPGRGLGYGGSSEEYEPSEGGCCCLNCGEDRSRCRAPRAAISPVT